MGWLRKECSICLRTSCRGHTTDRRLGDPRTHIRSYQTKGLTSWSKKKPKR